MTKPYRATLVETGAFHYVNRKGVMYFLHLTPEGKRPARYTMTKYAEGAVDELPPGYMVSESPNGLVSVRVVNARLIASEEEELVKERLSAAGLSRYRVEVKDSAIIIHEAHGYTVDELETMRPFSPAVKEVAFRIYLKTYGKRKTKETTKAFDQHWEEEKVDFCEKMTSYSPVLRFKLSDQRSRLFIVARMGGRVPGWLELDDLPLPKALDRYLHHLGKDRFYELI
jgi:hypothetical protein